MREDATNFNAHTSEQLVESGRATRDEVDEIVAAWHSWSEAPDGWFSVLHGEVLARV